MAYRVTVQSIEPAANGQLHLDAFVEYEASANNWQVTQNGHFTIVLNAAQVMSIWNGAGTLAQKKQAIAALIKDEARAKGIDKADEAYATLNKLANFPVSIPI